MDYETLRNSMTVQDAARVLRDTNCYGTMDIAKNVILKALEQQMSHSEEPNEWINKPQESEDEKVIRIKKGTLKARTGKYVVYDVEWLKKHFDTTEAKIYGQPKAEGARSDIPLQQSVPKMPQPNEHTETHECDCISRKAVLDALHRYFADGFDSDKWWNSTYVLDAVNRVPSATPQPKVGRWIGHREHCEKLGLIPSGLGVYEWCSNCGHGIDIRDWYRISHNYCPECGVKMQEVQQ